MSWTLEWQPVACRDLLAIHWRTAARIDAALMRFATTGSGTATRVVPTDPRRLRLAVHGAVAVVYLNRETSTIHVMRVFARG